MDRSCHLSAWERAGVRDSREKDPPQDFSCRFSARIPTERVGLAVGGGLCALRGTNDGHRRASSGNAEPRRGTNRASACGIDGRSPRRVAWRILVDNWGSVLGVGEWSTSARNEPNQGPDRSHGTNRPITFVHNRERAWDAAVGPSRCETNPLRSPSRRGTKPKTGAAAPKRTQFRPRTAGSDFMIANMG
jgi:hypothetical protein